MDKLLGKIERQVDTKQEFRNRIKCMNKIIRKPHSRIDITISPTKRIKKPSCAALLKI
jgi:hypothetical protein